MTSRSGAERQLLLLDLAYQVVFDNLKVDHLEAVRSSKS
jgi:hypothetical protein